MPITPLPIPKGFRRLSNFALDPSSVFFSVADLQAYAATNATAYIGQTCAVVEGDEAKLYIINADKVPVVASGEGSSLSKFLEARQDILAGTNAPTTNLSISEELDQTIFHRPNSAFFPAQKGWIESVSNVTLGNTPFIEGQDFVFAKDRQCFYFLQKRQPGISVINGVASANFIFFTIEISCHTTSPGHVSTDIPVKSPYFNVASVMVGSEDANDGALEFYYDRPTATLFLKQKFSFSGGIVHFKTELDGDAEMEIQAFSDVSSIAVPKNLWPSIPEIFVNGEKLATSEYSFGSNAITFSETLPPGSHVRAVGSVITYNNYNFSGGTLDLPASLKSVSSMFTFNTKMAWPEGTVLSAGDDPSGEDFGTLSQMAAFEETDSASESNVLHLAYNFPTGSAVGLFTVEAIFDADGSFGAPKNYTFKFQAICSQLELPGRLGNVDKFKLGDEYTVVVFDEAAQKLLFTLPISGTLNYAATHRGYQGLANGGETFEILEEIPGIYATTCGTGHYLSTLRTIDPPLDWYWWWALEWEREMVQIVAEGGNIVVYEDESEGAYYKTRPGYTTDEIKPLTLKLPLAPLYPLDRRDDRSFFQEAFSPNFTNTSFNSATYPALDDSQRYAADSVAIGKTITLSTNKTVPVRGVQGLNFTGPKPTFYAGGTAPLICLATYKWFAVKCTDTSSNPNLTTGSTYMLCVNNVHFESRAIMVTLTNEGYNVAADVFPIGGSN